MDNLKNFIDNWEATRSIDREEAYGIADSIAKDFISAANEHTKNNQEFFATVEAWARMLESVAATMDLYSLYIKDEIAKQSEDFTSSLMK